MRRARGYLITYDPAFACPQEIDTFKCLHCQMTIDKPPFKQPTDDVNGVALGGYCHKCDGPVCPNCAGKPCMPVEKWCDMIESKLHYDAVLGRK